MMVNIELEDLHNSAERMSRLRHHRDELIAALELVLSYADDHVLWPSYIRQKARDALDMEVDGHE